MNRDALLKWAKEIKQYIKEQAETDWQQCRTAKRAEQPPKEVKPHITGTFTVEFTGGDCGTLKTTNFGVTENADTSGQGDPVLVVDFPSDEGPQVKLDGSYHANSYGFSADLTCNNDTGASTHVFGGLDTSADWRLSVRGSFDVDNEGRTIMRGSGTLERLKTGRNCDFTYIGKAVG